MYKVYMRKNNITKKSYIGITSKTLDARSGKNGCNYCIKEKGIYKHPKFAQAIKKYGWNSFDSIILEEVETISDARQLEKEYIKKYNTFINGYNSSPGGDFVYNSSKPIIMIDYETGEFIKEFKSATIAAEELGLKTNTNIIRCCKGKCDSAGKFNNNCVSWRYKNETEDEKLERLKNKNIRIDKKKKKLEKFYSYNDTKKISVKMVYYGEPDNIIKEFSSISDAAEFIGLYNTSHIIECYQGKRNYAGSFNGIPVTWRSDNFDKDIFEKNCKERFCKVETKYKKIAELKTHSKPIEGISVENGRCLIFDSIKAASDFLGLKNGSTISNCLNGRQKTSAGYYWKYKK